MTKTTKNKGPAALAGFGVSQVAGKGAKVRTMFWKLKPG